MIVLKRIAEFKDSVGSLVVIERDQDGKWYVKNNGVETQKHLNASEIVRYLANAANRTA